MTEATDAAGGDDGKTREALEAALREVDAGEQEITALLQSMQPNVIDPMVQAVGEMAASVTSVKEALETLRTELAKLFHGLRTVINTELLKLEGGAAS